MQLFQCCLVLSFELFAQVVRNLLEEIDLVFGVVVLDEGANLLDLICKLRGDMQSVMPPGVFFKVLLPFSDSYASISIWFFLFLILRGRMNSGSKR